MGDMSPTIRITYDGPLSPMIPEGNLNEWLLGAAYFTKVPGFTPLPFEILNTGASLGHLEFTTSWKRAWNLEKKIED